MKFDWDDLIKAIETGNWELKIHPGANQFYLEVKNYEKCHDPNFDPTLQMWLLRQSKDVWQGTSALFFDMTQDADIFGSIIFKLHEKYGEDFVKHLIWISNKKSGR